MSRVILMMALLLLAGCGDDDGRASPPESELDATAPADASGKPREARSEDVSGDNRNGGAGGKGQDGASEPTSDATYAVDASESGPAADAAVDALPDGAVLKAIWSCPASYYKDGVVCDCGCLKTDPDCMGLGCTEPGCTADACEVCNNASGQFACVSSASWSCVVQLQSDGVCDCGCGNADPDCSGRGCTASGCLADGCSRCHAQDGSEISCQAEHWLCSSAANGSGDGCDCGCGLADPDCGGAGCTAPGCDTQTCNRCHDLFGRVAPCAGWTCSPLYYADGYCDCGCSRSDPDCPASSCMDYPCLDDSACHYCFDGTGAALPCSGWNCKTSWLKNDICDCGCGGYDPECERADPGCIAPDCQPTASCEMCITSGVRISCDWSCDPLKYDEGSATGCDCGCGAADPDCSVLSTCSEPGCWASKCDHCYDERGQESLTCATSNCDPSILGKGDGICDCGCGGIDPDCTQSGKAGCGPVGCGVIGCDRCYDSAGKELVCWQCDLASQNDAVCDCGCGAQDRACPVDQGCAYPGCAVTGCEVCHGSNGEILVCGGG